MLAEVGVVTLGGMITAWASNVASDWTANLLGATNRQMRRAFKASERREALEEALGLALMAALYYLEACHEGQWYDPDWFAEWLQRDEVVDEFSVLLTQDEESLNVGLLREEFEAAGLGQQELGKASFEELVKCIVAGFSITAADQPLLREYLKLGLLEKMVERMGALERLHEVARWVKRQAAISQQKLMLQRVQNRLLEQIRDKLPLGNQLFTQAELAAIEHNYRQTVVEWFETLSFQGISPSGRAIALPLAEVYVELKAVAEVPEAADTFSADERRLLLMADEEGVDHAELKMHLDTLRIERWREKARQQSKVLQRRSIHETLNEANQHGVVILGDPGAGKTTLLHYLALCAAQGKGRTAEQLPIFVPLAAYDAYLRDNEPHLPLEEFLAIYHAKWRAWPGLEQLFTQTLQAGRALVLLDGLDEVLENYTRKSVAQQAEAFIQRWVGQGNRFALTSRIVGYREAPLSNRLPHVTVLDFGRPEIEQFAKQWCYAYETWVADGKRTMVVEQRAEREMEKLLADIRSNPSVERLAANPLLLTMLALLRRQVGKLPDRRIELYERHTRTLIDNWEEARSQGARQHAPQRFDPHTAIFYLIELAFWLQQHKPSGTASRRELEKQLEIICLEFEGHDIHHATAKMRRDAQKEATRFLNDMRHFAGLLAERGQNAFGFLHLTFQEYFAGRALARMSEDERQTVLKPYLHHPRWREPILLCAGQLGIIEQRRDQVSQLVRWILHANSEHEAILHRDTFLAVAIARDDVGLAPFVLEMLAEKLIPLQKSNIPTVRDNALAGLALLVKLNDETALIALQDSLDEAKLVLHTIKALEPVIGSDHCVGLQQEIRSYLSNYNPNLRQAAVEVLAPLVIKDDIREQILACLSDDQWYVRQAAVQALAGQMGLNKTLREKILAGLSDDNWYVRQTAVQALAGQVGQDENLCQEILTYIFDYDPNVRQAVVEGLSPLVSQKEIRQRILATLSDDDDPNVRQAAVEALAPVVGQDQISQQILRCLSYGDNDERQAAIKALTPLVGQDKGLQEEILSCLSEFDNDVRQAAVEALAPVVAQDDSLRQQILNDLSDDQWYVRQAAVQALAPFVAQYDIRQQIRAQLSDPDHDVRQAAVEALASVVGQDDIRQQILPHLFDSDHDVRQAAVEALAPIVAQDESLAQEIQARLSDLDGRVRQAAMQALTPLMGQDEIRKQILSCLSDSDNDVRQLAVKILAGFVTENKSLRRQIVNKLDNLSYNIWQREVGVIEALAPVVGQDKILCQQIQSRLSDNDSSVRQAAVQALASLVEEDQIHKQIRLSLSDHDSRVRQAAVEALTPLVRQDETLCQQIRARLFDHDSRVRQTAVMVLAPLVGQDETLYKQIQDRLSDRDGRVRQAAIKALDPLKRQDKIPQSISGQFSSRDYQVQQTVIKPLPSLVRQDENLRKEIFPHLSDPDYRIRQATVQKLVPFIKQNKEVTTLLVDWLGFVIEIDWIFDKSTGKATRQLLANAYGPLLADDSALFKQVVKMLDSVSWAAREGAARALIAMPEGPPAHLMPELRALLDDNRAEESWPERLQVAELLINGRDRQLSEQAIDVTLEALDFATQPWYHMPRLGPQVRKQAAQSLGQLEPLYRDERVFARLARVLEEDEDAEVRDAAYGALLRLAAAPER